jgi:hypothetical protein
MVTRFVTSPPTDNCPQPKEALPAVSTSTLPYYICLTPRLRNLIDGPEVEHGAHFLILYYPATPHAAVCSTTHGHGLYSCPFVLAVMLRGAGGRWVRAQFDHSKNMENIGPQRVKWVAWSSDHTSPRDIVVTKTGTVYVTGLVTDAGNATFGTGVGAPVVDFGQCSSKSVCSYLEKISSSVRPPPPSLLRAVRVRIRPARRVLTQHTPIRRGSARSNGDQRVNPLPSSN